MSETTAKIWLLVVAIFARIKLGIKKAFKSMTSPFNMLVAALLGFGTAMYTAPAGIGAATIVVAGFAITSIAWTIGFITDVAINVVIKPFFDKIVGFFMKEARVEIVEEVREGNDPNRHVKDFQKARARARTYDVRDDGGYYQVYDVKDDGGYYQACGH